MGKLGRKFLLLAVEEAEGIFIRAQIELFGIGTGGIEFVDGGVGVFGRASADEPGSFFGECFGSITGSFVGLFQLINGRVRVEREFEQYAGAIGAEDRAGEAAE